MRTVLAGVVLLGSVAAIASPALAAIPIFGQAQLTAQTRVVEADGTYQEQMGRDGPTWHDSPTPLSAMVSTVAASPTAGSSSVFGAEHAEWYSADEGVFQLQNLDFDLTLHPPGLGGSAHIESFWEYTFDATEDAYFNLTYVFNGTGHTEIGESWLFFVHDTRVEIPTYASPGTISFLLHPGHRYVVDLSFNPNVGASANLDGYMAHFAADFGWNISSEAEGEVFRLVPEPSSWALFILGFAAVGGLVRRKRAAACLAS